MVPLSRALQYHSATIKNLSLSDISGINTTAGWRTIIQLLRDPDSALETLDLSDNIITNGELIALESALVNNSRLRELYLQSSGSVTPKGWKTLSRVLHNPNSSLEVLDLGNNRISGRVLLSFAEALVTNRRLRELKVDLIYKRIHNFTSDGLDAFTRILCDNLSIPNTYYSNHTLERIWSDDSKRIIGSEYLKSLLRLNNEMRKFQVARLKITMEQFSGDDINMQLFADMKLSVRPQAIAWMAQDNHLYKFLRTSPLLLEIQRSSQNLRKRSCQ